MRINGVLVGYNRKGCSGMQEIIIGVSDANENMIIPLLKKVELILNNNEDAGDKNGKRRRID